MLRDRLGADKVRFVGIGGAKMAAEGVESPFDIAQLSILGIVESLKAYPRAMARLKDTLALAAREKPDVAVLIDSWGFNIRLAKALRKQDPGLPLVKHVAPQVWAYRAGRAKDLADGGRPAAVDPADGQAVLRRRRPAQTCSSAIRPWPTTSATPTRLGCAPRSARGLDEPILLVAARQPPIRDPASHAAVRGRRAPAEGPAARTCTSSCPPPRRWPTTRARHGSRPGRSGPM